MEIKACGLDGCDRVAYCKGLCSGHYAQRQRGAEFSPLRPKIKERGCDFADCEGAHYAKGLCNPHYQQTLRDVPMTPIRRPTGMGCHFEGCDRPLASRDWCQAHWAQIKKGQTLAELEPRLKQQGNPCVFPRCDFEATRKSLCEEHGYLSKYRLSPDRIRELFTDPECAICHSTEPGKRNFHVDHDHACCPASVSCGKCVRGLLCARCNHGLGLFHDNEETLWSAIQYLRNARSSTERLTLVA